MQENITISNNNNNNQTESLQNNNNYNEIIRHDISENIVTSIVDKIISEIIINKKIEKIYTKLPDHCYNYINNLLITFFNGNFFYHEDGIDDLKYQKEKIYYNRQPLTKVNTWVKLEEPPNSITDRHNAGKNKYKEFECPSPSKNPLSGKPTTITEEFEKVINDNIWQRDKMKKKNKSFAYLLKKKELTRQKEKLNLNKKNININNIYEEARKKNKEKILPLDLPYYDLPKEKYENIYTIINDNEENTQLRKEREQQIQKKEQERAIEEEKKKKAKKIRFQNKKDFDFNKLSFDPNGKVINVKNQNSDKFLKDFASLKFHVTEKKIKNNLRNSLKSTDENVGKKMIRRGSQLSLRRKSNIKIEKNPVEKESEDYFDVGINKKRVGTEIKVSGNNYAQIYPEVGVRISNGIKNMEKEGGFDFVRKYNKPSMIEFSRIASQNNIFSSNLASTYDINSSLPSINGEQNKNENYIGYKIEFNDNNNPLFEGAHHIISCSSQSSKLAKKNKKLLKIRQINSSENIINNGYRRRINKNYETLETDINNKYNNNLNSIKLNENYYSLNLQSIFYDKNDINNQIINNKDIENSISVVKKNNSYLNKAVSITNNNRYKRRNLPLITETINDNKNVMDELVNKNYINQFNFHIIKNKEWGNQLGDSNVVNSVIKSHDGGLFRRNVNNNRLKESGIKVINCVRDRTKEPLGPYSKIKDIKTIDYEI